ncbi:MAG: histidinol dehydrogenase [Alphaproteobacteria bacterium]|nr:histidinol dehydrogenase [Alphaproteobacteria bacterium]
MPRRLDSAAIDFEAAFSELLGEKREADDDVGKVVADILAAVREEGDAAVLKFTEQFDRVKLTADEMRVPASEIAAARTSCDKDVLAALTTAHVRISEFHRHQIPADIDYVDDNGVRLGGRWRPVAAAGLYVPGGTAAYPSSVLMNAVPAQVAGVERIVMVVPAPDGVLNPLVLAAADLAGVSEIYRIGGAQAVGALAYGTQTIAAVDKIVGPGNAYVAAAKRQVFGTVGIDMIAGPSEILIVADGDNDPAWIAADLLSQAEHDRAAQSLLITDDAAFADAVAAAVETHLSTLPRADIARDSWQNYGAIILVPSLDAAIPLIDRIAPEHLELACGDADALADNVRNAGAIFVGAYTPEVIGDYVAGPNHVLPTGRTSRFSSGLSVLDFLKRSSLISCSVEGLRAIGPAAVTLANAEGLQAHALSVKIRLNDET